MTIVSTFWCINQTSDTMKSIHQRTHTRAHTHKIDSNSISRYILFLVGVSNPDWRPTPDYDQRKPIPTDCYSGRESVQVFHDLGTGVGSGRFRSNTVKNDKKRPTPTKPKPILPDRFQPTTIGSVVGLRFHLKSGSGCVGIGQMLSPSSWYIINLGYVIWFCMLRLKILYNLYSKPTPE